MTGNASASSDAGGRQLSRSLKNWHIQMIALGSAPGTGLFYGSGEAIAMPGRQYCCLILLAGQ